MNILIEKNVIVPMRDGVKLAADVYRPAEGGPFPVIIQRLPYNKDLPAITMLLMDIFRIVQAGYVMVMQDTRGQFAAEGECNPFFQEPTDGADTIAWAARAPWSNGKVGLAGGSYFGATQWLAAREAPEALLAMVPTITSADYYESWTYQGGAFQLGFILMWTLGFALAEQQSRLKTGQATYELHITVGATSQVFGAGHCIRLEVSSSNFPRFDRNTNTGGTIATESEKDFVQAVNRVFHDAANPSHLILPIIERD